MKVLKGFIIIGAVLTSVLSANMDKVNDLTCDQLYGQAIFNYKQAFRDKGSSDNAILHSNIGMFTMELYKECIRRRTEVEVIKELAGIKEELTNIKLEISDLKSDESTDSTDSYSNSY